LYPGKVEDFVYNGQAEDSSKYDHFDRKDHRRFFRDSERAYLGGVSAGLENISALILFGYDWYSLLLL